MQFLYVGAKNAIQKFQDPDWDQVYSALKSINKKEGRTYVKLQHEVSESYVMCYGSKRALLIEYYDAENQSFLLGEGIEKPVETLIQGSAGPVRVHLNEILAVANAYDVFEFFHRANTIPSRYSLRAKQTQLELQNL
ncbi:MAG: hypothetical protein AAF502_22980 [Bacteroidota bacterium]